MNKTLLTANGRLATYFVQTLSVNREYFCTRRYVGSYMRSVAVFSVFVALTSITFAETREAKVDRLYQFFNIQESEEYRLKSRALRFRTSAQEAVDQALATLPNDTHATERKRVLDALSSLNDALNNLESIPIGQVWKSFLVERLSDEDLDAAIAFFYSPSGGRFVGNKAVADSILVGHIERKFREILRPQLDQLDATLRSIQRP
jgi:hypothetical protein